MEELNGHTQQQKMRPKIIKIVANILISVVGLSTGAAIVHGMVFQQCVVKKQIFVAGVVPPDFQKSSQSQEQTGEPVDIQKCVNSQNGDDTVFEAGVLPVEDMEGGIAGQTDTDPQTAKTPSVQGATPISQPTPQPRPQPPVTVIQTAAPAPQALLEQIPAPSPAVQPAPVQKPVVAPTPAPAPSTPAAKRTVKPGPVPPPAKATTAAKTIQPPVKKAVVPKTTPVKPKTIGVDLDKLSKAVAMQETHNCADTKGSALVNNCHGFKKNGKFMSFGSPAESHAYFKQLWARSYGGFPTYRMAQIYSGNDRPNQWLKNVTYYYNTL